MHPCIALHCIAYSVAAVLGTKRFGWLRRVDRSAGRPANQAIPYYDSIRAKFSFRLFRRLFVRSFVPHDKRNRCDAASTHHPTGRTVPPPTNERMHQPTIHTRKCYSCKHKVFTGMAWHGRLEQTTLPSYCCCSAYPTYRKPVGSTTINNTAQ